MQQGGKFTNVEKKEHFSYLLHIIDPALQLPEYSSLHLSFTVDSALLWVAICVGSRRVRCVKSLHLHRYCFY